jgi:hypothetical protein
MQSPAIQIVATEAIQHGGWRICCICEQPFKPIGARSKGRLCQRSACRSELGRRNGRPRKDSRPPDEPIRPIDRGFRTVLQPCIAPYIAAMAAASAAA